MNNAILDTLLFVLASPILFIRFVLWCVRRYRFWRVSYSPSLVCRNCNATIWLVGIWRCRCGYTYQGHLLRECRVCHGWPVMARCFECGLTEKLPGP